MSADDTGDFRVIRPAIVSSLEEVRLYDETLDKIAKDHAELNLASTVLGSALLSSAIEEAVANPTRLHNSATSSASVVFISNRATHLGNPIVVPVKRIEGTASGRVQTAYFSDNDYPGTLIWSADNE
jgi:hypothetical protein